MGSSLARSESQTDSRPKATAYCIESEVVDGMDVAAIEAATCRAVAKIREAERQNLIYWRRAHTAFARIRCLTRSSIATRPRLPKGARRAQSCGSRVGFWKTA